MSVGIMVGWIGSDSSGFGSHRRSSGSRHGMNRCRKRLIGRAKPIGRSTGAGMRWANQLANPRPFGNQLCDMAGPFDGRAVIASFTYKKEPVFPQRIGYQDAGQAVDMVVGEADLSRRAGGLLPGDPFEDGFDSQQRNAVPGRPRCGVDGNGFTLNP